MQVHECRCEQYYNIHTIPVQEVELLFVCEQLKSS